MLQKNHTTIQTYKLIVFGLGWALSTTHCFNFFIFGVFFGGGQGVFGHILMVITTDLAFFQAPITQALFHLSLIQTQSVVFWILLPSLSVPPKPSSFILTFTFLSNLRKWVSSLLLLF